LNNPDIKVFGLAPKKTTLEWLNEYVRQEAVTFDMLYNADEVFAAYGIYEEPTYIVIDKKGLVRFRDDQYYFYRINELIDRIQPLLNE
jgi:hypothetical protein